MRQWVPQVQKKIHFIALELFKRGLDVNDRDSLTDMNLLHFVAKSGAYGMADDKTTRLLTTMLLEKGIHVNAKCKWTDMSALHYAVFFDVHGAAKLILEHGSFNGKTNVFSNNSLFLNYNNDNIWKINFKD